MKRLLTIGLVLAWLAPASAFAREAEFGIRSTATWTDNVFGTRGDEEDDFSLRLEPFVTLEEDSGPLRWQLFYRPGYEYFLDTSAIRGFDHDARASASWLIDARTTLRVSEHFQRYRSVSRFNDVGGVTTFVSEGVRKPFKRNQASLALIHQLTRRDRLSLQLGHQIWDFAEEDANRDHETLRGSLSWQRVLTKRLQAGATAAWRRQSVERVGLSDEETDYYTVSLDVEWHFDKTTSLALSAGPTRIEPHTDIVQRTFASPGFLTMDVGGQSFLVDATSCRSRQVNLTPAQQLRYGLPATATLYEVAADPRFVSCQPLGNALTPFDQASLSFATLLAPLPVVDPAGSDADGRTTVFASAALEKRWKTVVGELSFSRHENDRPGVGSNSILTQARLELRWAATQRLDLTLIGTWQEREQAITTTIFLAQPSAGHPFVSPSLVVGSAVPVLHTQGSSRSDREIETLRAHLVANYQLGRRTNLYANVHWSEEESSRGFSTDETTDRTSIWVGIEHRFDPIEF